MNSLDRKKVAVITSYVQESFSETDAVIDEVKAWQARPLTCRQNHETGLSGTGYWRPSASTAQETAKPKNHAWNSNDRFLMSD